MARNRYWILLAVPILAVVVWGWWQEEQAFLSVNSSIPEPTVLTGSKSGSEESPQLQSRRFDRERREVVASRRESVPPGVSQRDGAVSDQESTLPIILRGLVVDPTGAPIRNAAIALIVAQPGQSHPENRRELPKVISGDDGDFTLRGVPPESAFQLHATRPGYVVDSMLTVELGTTFALIIMFPTGALRGQVRLGPDQSHKDFCMFLAGGTERLEGSLGPPDPVTGLHDYRFEEVLPGVYEFGFDSRQVDGASRVLFSRVVIPADRLCEDPRLRIVDLTTEIRTLKLTILDDQGRPLAKASVSPHKANRFPPPVQTNSEGIAVLPKAEKPMSITVHHPDYMVARRTDIDADQVVRLESPLDVEFHVSVPDAIRARFPRVELKVTPRDLDLARRMASMSRVVDQGTAIPGNGDSRVPLQFRGEASVRINLFQSESALFAAATIEPTPSIITIPESGTRFAFTLHINEDAVPTELPGATPR